MDYEVGKRAIKQRLRNGRTELVVVEAISTNGKEVLVRTEDGTRFFFWDTGKGSGLRDSTGHYVLLPYAATPPRTRKRPMYGKGDVVRVYTLQNDTIWDTATIDNVYWLRGAPTRGGMTATTAGGFPLNMWWVAQNGRWENPDHGIYIKPKSED